MYESISVSGSPAEAHDNFTNFCKNDKLYLFLYKTIIGEIAGCFISIRRIAF